MFDYITGVIQNAAYYVKTHRPFGTPKAKTLTDFYENEAALDALISKYPTEVKKWLELQFDCASARR